MQDTIGSQRKMPGTLTVFAYMISAKQRGNRWKNV